jgi:hypothetical protein
VSGFPIIATDVTCPKCGAVPGERCRRVSSRQTWPHDAREIEANRLRQKPVRR